MQRQVFSMDWMRTGLLRDPGGGQQVQNVFLCGREETEPFLWPAGRPLGPVEAVEEAGADLVLLQHQRDGLALVQRRPPGTAALGVGGECGLHLVSQS
jgi:hypothetical protein